MTMNQGIPADQSTRDVVAGNSMHSEQVANEETGETAAHFTQHSPQQIDQTIQQQGKDPHELLQMFKHANAELLSSFILQTPTQKADAKNQETPEKDKKQEILRKSPRLKVKDTKGKTITKKAQALVAKKCGIVEEEKQLESMTLQHYLHMYKQPLCEEYVEAITKLYEVAVEKQKKKEKKKKKNSEAKTQGTVKEVTKKAKKTARVVSASANGAMA
jgi:hypothetical protein